MTQQSFEGMETKRVWHKQTPEAREKMRQAALRRWPSALKRYGITEEQYRSEIAKGNKWCNAHKEFHPRSAFGNPDKWAPCKEAIRVRSIANWHGFSEEKRKKISREQYDKHETPERTRKRMLWFHYRITLEEYDALLKKQDGKCALCLRPRRKRPLAVDHDHSCCKGNRICGRCVRGLICTPCNRAVGSIEFWPGWLERYLEYRKTYNPVASPRDVLEPKKIYRRASLPPLKEEGALSESALSHLNLLEETHETESA